VMRRGVQRGGCPYAECVRVSLTSIYIFLLFGERGGLTTGRLRPTYHRSRPFKGAILAGMFTEGALNQLRSLGFNVMYLRYAAIIEAFKQIGIDANSDERTPDAAFQQKVDQYEALSFAQRRQLDAALLEGSVEDVDSFIESLTAAVSRHVESIIVLPLHGKRYETTSIDEAVALLEHYDEALAPAGFERYEVHVRFSSGNEIVGKFNAKPSAIEFLHSH